MTQKRFEGMANRTSRIVAAFAVVLMLAGVCGGKASAQGGSGKLDKALNGEWIWVEKEVYSFDSGNVTYVWAGDKPLMKRGTFETRAGAVAPDGKKRDDISWVFFTWKEDYDFETGKWAAKEKPWTNEFFYHFTDDDTFVLENSKGDKWTYKKGKYLKEYKRVAEIKAMSVEELKKQPPAPESDFLVKPIDDSFTAVKVTKYKGSDPLVVIPATIQGLPVKEIGEEAFYGNGDIVAVVTPEGMSVIGEEAFHGCPNLSVAVISEGVTVINFGAFEWCENLSSVVLPSTLKAIGGCAFKPLVGGRSSLKSIELPAGLLYIGQSAFSQTWLTSVKLPEGLLYIGESAFYGTPLTSVSLPKSLRLIGRHAFGGCGSLADIQLHEDHAISIWYDGWGDNYGREESFEGFFHGTKINESIALQKLLKETKTRAISKKEFNGILADIAKQIGAKDISVRTIFW